MEELLRLHGGDDFNVESAGLEPRPINPLVLEVMKEIGVDLSNKEPKDVWELFKGERMYDYIITVCSMEDDKRCPIFPGVLKRLNWPYPDPRKFKGTQEEKLQQTRELRDMMTRRTKDFIMFVKTNKDLGDIEVR